VFSSDSVFVGVTQRASQQRTDAGDDRLPSGLDAHPIGRLLFYLPIVWVGYDPVWVYGMVSASLSYQFFIHTELVPRVGWVEWLVNTPSAHRVHHASNPEYIDKNYGGVLLIWDHLFGSYQAERSDIPIRYGLAHPRSAPNNPFVIAYEELWQTLKAALRAGSVRERIAILTGPP
jgi:sterol desaturase/sphingolipid hydroxylase (fatty acid hydroxylase superfamily)